LFFYSSEAKVTTPTKVHARAQQMAESLPFLDLENIPGQSAETGCNMDETASSIDLDCSSMSEESVSSEESTSFTSDLGLSPVKEEAETGADDSVVHYSDSSDSEDEESDIEKLLALRAEELAAANNLGLTFRCLEKSAEANFRASKKVQRVKSAVSNPMQFEAVRLRVNKVRAMTKHLTAHVLSATADAVDVAKKTYEGYQVTDNGDGVRTITKIDMLEQELAELKAMMKQMAVMNSNLGKQREMAGGGGDDREAREPFHSTMQEARDKKTIETPVEKAVEQAKPSNKVHPCAALLRNIGSKTALKKVKGRRSLGGTPKVAVKTHKKSGSFNASMLQQALNKKFKNAHCDSSSDEDSDSDSSFSSSSSCSSYSSDEEEESEQRPKVVRIPFNKPASRPTIKQAVKVTNAVGQASETKAPKASLAFLDGIKSFDKKKTLTPVKHSESKTERRSPTGTKRNNGNVSTAKEKIVKKQMPTGLLGSIKAFKKSRGLTPVKKEEKPKATKEDMSAGHRLNLLNEIKIFKKKSSLAPSLPTKQCSLDSPGPSKNHFLSAIQNFNIKKNLRKTPVREKKAKESKRIAKNAGPVAGNVFADAILNRRNMLRKTHKRFEKKERNENSITGMNSDQSSPQKNPFLKVQLKKVVRSTSNAENAWV
jgi:hypothetical protein